MWNKDFQNGRRFFVGLTKPLRFIVIFLVITGWVFSGWPQIFNFPQKIETAQAAVNDATVEVLGGGGGGGVRAARGGGGGGGGEYRRCTETLSVQSYTVTVGVGSAEDSTADTDSTFSGTGITLTADGGQGSNNQNGGAGGTLGVSTGCDVADANFDGGTGGNSNNTGDTSGGGGGGAGFFGIGGNGGSGSTNGVGGGGGGGAGETGVGGDGSAPTAGTAGAGGGGAGGAGGNAAVGAAGNTGTPATFHIVSGGGGGGGDDGFNGGACGAPGAGAGGGEISGAGSGCRGEVRIIYVDSEISATGGTETTSGSFRIHTFTTDGTFTVSTITTAAATLTQNDFEFFVDNNALTPTDVWGNPDIAENVAVDAIPPSNDPIDKGDHIRLRMNISVTDNQLDAGAEGFILQYARASDCTTGPSWTDVDPFGTAGATWRFFDNGSITDGTALDGGALTLTTSEEEGRYSELDPTSTNPVAVPAGQELEWDWNIEYDGTAAVNEARTYCFRMRTDAPADLDAYNSDSYPRIDIRPSTADQLRHGNFFTEGVERGFFWAD